MNNKKKALKISALATGALVGTVGVTHATNLFTADDLGTGYELRSDLIAKHDALGQFVDNQHIELKCGEGTCGEKSEEKTEKKKAASKESKASEHKCGEGKCGEGKCGEEMEKSEKKAKMKKSEKSKSGEHKCGEGKCGGH